MTPLVRRSHSVHWQTAFSARYVSEKIGSSILWTAHQVGIFMIEHKRAQAQAELYEKLSRMSDTELTKQGICRSEINQIVRDRLS